jgi:limonene 1,2-monooxygenase
MVMNVHVAETDEQALADVRVGERLETVKYFEDALGRPPGRSENPLSDGIAAGTTLVGSPDTVARGIQNLVKHSDGGFGGFLFRAHDWADREQTWRSYELFARWVMPRFQQSLDTIEGSYDWAVANRKTIFGPNVAALKRAFTDAGREPPEAFAARAAGARDS